MCNFDVFTIPLPQTPSTQSKTFVLGLVPTPNTDGSSNFDDEGRITKEKENVLATPDLESWFTQHLHQVFFEKPLDYSFMVIPTYYFQVRRMLVGGLHVLGIYVFASDKDYSSHEKTIYNLAAAVR